MSDTTDMKYKSVAYYDLFNQEEVVVASNRLWSPTKLAPRVYTQIKEPVYHGTREEFLRERSKTTKCRCRHKFMVGGICHYRTCRHDEATHR